MLASTAKEPFWKYIWLICSYCQLLLWTTSYRNKLLLFRFLELPKFWFTILPLFMWAWNWTSLGNHEKWLLPPIPKKEQNQNDSNSGVLSLASCVMQPLHQPEPFIVHQDDVEISSLLPTPNPISFFMSMHPTLQNRFKA